MVKPILFTTPMVSAILAGKKTQARQIIQNVPRSMYGWDYSDQDDTFVAVCGIGRAGCLLKFEVPLKPPYKVGNILQINGMLRFLEVKNVYIQKLQEITKNDVIKEGFKGIRCNHLNISKTTFDCENCNNTGWVKYPEHEFREYRDTYNAKRGFGWDDNPWVWVIEFERMKGE